MDKREEFVIGIDVGTLSTRAGIFDFPVRSSQRVGRRFESGLLHQFSYFALSHSEVERYSNS